MYESKSKFPGALASDDRYWRRNSARIRNDGLRLILIAVLACCLATMVLGCGHANEQPAATTVAHPTTTTKCVEGDACWNCKTMGNHICGPRHYYGTHPTGQVEYR